jgi:hypothetical protein
MYGARAKVSACPAGCGVATGCHFLSLRILLLADVDHNLFVQVRGSKTFWLLPPAAHVRLHLHPASHPRCAVVAHATVLSTLLHLLHGAGDALVAAWQAGFMCLRACVRACVRVCACVVGHHILIVWVWRLGSWRQAQVMKPPGDAVAYKVVLAEGDALYLPPMWFHYVETTQDSIAINVWAGVVGPPWCALRHRFSTAPAVAPLKPTRNPVAACLPLCALACSPAHRVPRKQGTGRRGGCSPACPLPAVRVGCPVRPSCHRARRTRSRVPGRCGRAGTAGPWLPVSPAPARSCAPLPCLCRCCCSCLGALCLGSLVHPPSPRPLVASGHHVAIQNLLHRRFVPLLHAANAARGDRGGAHAPRGLWVGLLPKDRPCAGHAPAFGAQYPDAVAVVERVHAMLRGVGPDARVILFEVGAAAARVRTLCTVCID